MDREGKSLLPNSHRFHDRDDKSRKIRCKKKPLGRSSYWFESEMQSKPRTRTRVDRVITPDLSFRVRTTRTVSDAVSRDKGARENEEQMRIKRRNQSEKLGAINHIRDPLFVVPLVCLRGKSFTVLSCRQKRARDVFSPSQKYKGETHHRKP